MLRLLGTDALNKSQLFIGNIPAVQTDLLQFEFSGTNTATPLNISNGDCGDLVIKSKQFGQIVNIPFARLFDLNNIFAGNARNSSAASSAFQIVVHLPLYMFTAEKNDDNSLMITPDLGLEIYVNNFVNSRVSSGILSVSARPTLKPCKYVPYYDTMTRSLTAGQIDKNTVNYKNACMVFLYLSSNTINQVRIFNSQGNGVDSDYNKLMAYLNYAYKLESVLTTYALAEFNPSLELIERASNFLDFQIVSGTATSVQIITIGTIENQVTNAIRNASLVKMKEKAIEIARTPELREQLPAVASSIGVKTGVLKETAGIE